ncbi:uncharacterized protein LOC105834273 [Monomorium pharaonis]|uniref:uncharacterized protein LOC105834273 n=1 Tax=Monomorium pharaonis TaxID=307658 RepID=UPI001747D25B|nr:uncharacterized protein LOC105834273 [Monomorium pharaonis]
MLLFQMFLVFAMLCLFIAISISMSAIICDNVLHMNGSRTRQMLFFTSEYFIDQEKYGYIILLHSNAVLYIGITTVTAIGTMLRGYFIHACGLFKIASYRIEQALAIKIVKNISIENEMMIYKEIICAIDIHCKAIKLVFYP